MISLGAETRQASSPGLPLNVMHPTPSSICFLGTRIQHVARGHDLANFCPTGIRVAVGGRGTGLAAVLLTQYTRALPGQGDHPHLWGADEGGGDPEAGKSPFLRTQGPVQATDTPGECKGRAYLPAPE